jgi:hypothetical protein
MPTWAGTALASDVSLTPRSAIEVIPMSADRYQDGLERAKADTEYRLLYDRAKERDPGLVAGLPDPHAHDAPDFDPRDHLAAIRELIESEPGPRDFPGKFATVPPPGLRT